MHTGPQIANIDSNTEDNSSLNCELSLLGTAALCAWWGVSDNRILQFLCAELSTQTNVLSRVLADDSAHDWRQPSARAQVHACALMLIPLGTISITPKPKSKHSNQLSIIDPFTNSTISSISHSDFSMQVLLRARLVRGAEVTPEDFDWLTYKACDIRSSCCCVHAQSERILSDAHYQSNIQRRDSKWWTHRVYKFNALVQQLSSLLASTQHQYRPSQQICANHRLSSVTFAVAILIKKHQSENRVKLIVWSKCISRRYPDETSTPEKSSSSAYGIY